MSVPAGMVIVPAAKASERVAGAIEKAVTTPIYSRRTFERWDEDLQEWVPDTREREANITPAGFLAGALALLGLGVAVQRGLRTGTLLLVPTWETTATTEKDSVIQVPNPAYQAWLADPRPPSSFAAYGSDVGIGVGFGTPVATKGPPPPKTIDGVGPKVKRTRKFKTQAIPTQLPDGRFDTPNESTVPRAAYGEAGETVVIKYLGRKPRLNYRQGVAEYPVLAKLA